MLVEESLLCNANSAKYVQERSTLNYTHACVHVCVPCMCTCMYVYVYMCIVFMSL